MSATKGGAVDVEVLKARAKRAIERITSGLAPMRIPAQQDDPDLVIGDLVEALAAARARAESAERERDEARAALAFYAETWGSDQFGDEGARARRFLDRTLAPRVERAHGLEPGRAACDEKPADAAREGVDIVGGLPREVQDAITDYRRSSFNDGSAGNYGVSTASTMADAKLCAAIRAAIAAALRARGA